MEPRILILSKIMPDLEDPSTNEDIPFSPTSEQIRAALRTNLGCVETMPFSKLMFADTVNCFMYGGEVTAKILYPPYTRRNKTVSISIVNTDQMEVSSNYQMGLIKNAIRNFKPGLIVFDWDCLEQEIDRTVVGTMLDDIATELNSELVIYSFKLKEIKSEDGKEVPEDEKVFETIPLEFINTKEVKRMTIVKNIIATIAKYISEVFKQENETSAITEGIANDVQAIVQEPKTRIAEKAKKTLDILSASNEPKDKGTVEEVNQVKSKTTSVYNPNAVEAKGPTVDTLFKLISSIPEENRKNIRIDVKGDGDASIFTETIMSLNKKTNTLSISQHTAVHQASDFVNFTYSDILEVSKGGNDIVTFRNTETNAMFMVPVNTSPDMVVNMLAAIEVYKSEVVK